MLHTPGRFSEWLPYGFSGVFEWDFLADAKCFGNTRIKPMDIDAIVERKGQFLIFETKTSGAEFPQGQRITLDRLVQEKNKTVLFVEGKTADSITNYEVWYWDMANGRSAKWKPKKPCLDGLKNTCRNWYDNVDKGIHPSVGMPDAEYF